MMTDISRVTKVVELVTSAGFTARTADNKTKEVTADDASIDPRAASTFAAVDIIGHESVMFAVWGVDVANTTFSIKHGDKADALTMASPECVITAPAKAGDKVRNVGYIGAMRYVQLIASTSVVGVAIMQRPDVAPVK